MSSINPLDYFYLSEEEEEEEDYGDDDLYENDWNEEWESGDDDEWCREMDLPASKRRRMSVEQDGGALFEFELRHGTMPRRWKNVVNKTRHTARLQQRRDACPDDQLGEALTGALRKALLEAIAPERALTDNDKIHFTMQATAFAAGSNNCFQSTQFNIGELRQRSDRFETYLQQLSKQLNSSQSFSPGDDFDLDITTIRMPSAGSRGKKYDPAKALVRNIVKRCQVPVKNQDDQLCCARAIVTMRAYADEKADVFPEVAYATIRRGRPCQKRLAQRLMQEAGLVEGPCGAEELARLQTALPQYQLKVLQVGRPHMIVFAGPPQPRKILLLLEDDHYDGCTSYSAWFNVNYYCHDCDKGYNDDDIEHHPCIGRRCRSCLSLECGDYARCKAASRERLPRPTLHCDTCNRSCYGPECFQRHGEIPPNKKQSPCATWKKCQECSKVYK